MSDSEIILRPSEPEDRSRSRTILWSVGWHDPPEKHRTWPEADADWQSRRYLKEIVAEVDGVVAGRVALEAYRQPFAELCGLTVRPDYRKRGLGKLLTCAVEREAARRGFPFLFLQTALDNHAGHSLYSRMGFLPTAHETMLRMIKFLDYPLLDVFRNAHPLCQYTCKSVAGRSRAWDLEWHGYILDDYLRLRLEGGTSEFDSEGIGPALTGLDWRVEQGGRGLAIHLQTEPVRDIEPGYHVEIEIVLENHGKRMEAGIFQVAQPPGLHLSSPATNVTKIFAWEVAPGERITQPIVVRIDPDFDPGALYYLNYQSLPVSIETYWEGHRALLSVSLPMAAPPPGM